MEDEEGQGGSPLAGIAARQGAKKAGEAVGKEVGKHVGQQAGKEVAKEGVKAGAQAGAHAAGQALGSAAPVIGNIAAFLVTEGLGKVWQYRKPIAAALVVLLILSVSPFLLITTTVGAAEQAIANLTYKPVAGVAIAAYAASSACDFAGPNDPGKVGVYLSTTYLVAMAFEATGSVDPVTSAGGTVSGSLFFGNYRNPLADHNIPLNSPQNLLKGVPAGMDMNTAGLATGGETASLINATSGLTPEQWTSILPNSKGEHGVGFLLITPTDWQNDIAQITQAKLWPQGVDPSKLSPWRPQDAFLVIACHLKQQVASLIATGQAAATAVSNALVSLGNTVTQIYEIAKTFVSTLVSDITNLPKLALDLASLADSILTQFTGNGNMYVTYLQGFLSGHLVGIGGNGTPIPGGQCVPTCPSGIKPVGLPSFYYDAPKFPNYDAYAWGIVSIFDKNQCTYGAIAEWLTLHQNDPAWYGPTIAAQHPFQGDATASQFYASAVAAGYTVSSAPVSGALVVYPAYYFGPLFPAGHIATVVGVSSDGRHYMVLEQNFLNPEENYAEIGPGFPPYRWNQAGFNLRTASWPDPGIAGFIWGPPGTKVA